MNLVLSKEKCHFVVQEGVVLSYIVSNKGINVDKAKVKIIEKLLPPSSINDVRSFVGHVGFYWQLIKHFPKITKSLTHLLVKNVPFEFNEEFLSAFHRFKGALIFAAIMQASDWGLPLKVMCDTSDYVVGAVLGQQKDNKPNAIYCNATPVYIW